MDLNSTATVYTTHKLRTNLLGGVADHVERHLFLESNVISKTFDGAMMDYFMQLINMKLRGGQEQSFEEPQI